MSLPSSQKKSRRLIAVVILSGASFIAMAIVVSLLALNRVSQQQQFLCGLIGQAVVQQKATLDQRVQSTALFANYDTSGAIRSYFAAQHAVAVKQAKGFFDPALVRKATQGQCRKDIGEALARLAKQTKPPAHP
jgi:hypothetical protein